MKKTTIMFVLFLLANAFISNSYSQSDCPAGKYCGSKESFEAFKNKYHKDWPVPKEINYFDPDGKNQPVIRYAHWKPESESTRGVVVHFNGRTEFIEKNIYTYRDLLQRGLEVWAFDWRGQGLSQRKEIAEKQKHNIDTFDTYLDDVSYFLKNIVNIQNKKGKKILLAHSMGGQIALRYLLAHPDTFNYAILSSPLLRLPGDNFLLRASNPLKRLFGGGERCIGTQIDNLSQFDIYHSPEWSSDFQANKSCELVASNNIDLSSVVKISETKKYSNDLSKLADINCLIESSIDANGKENPDLRLACPTSNWLNAAFESTDTVMKNVAKLKTPTLIVRALPDNAVDNEGQTNFCTQAEAHCTIESVQKVNEMQAGHELLIENEAIRKIFFNAFDKHIGP